MRGERKKERKRERKRERERKQPLLAMITRAAAVVIVVSSRP